MPAQALLDRALQLDPESAALRQTYGRALLSAGELQPAVDPLREALRLDPDLPGLHRDLAIALERIGLTDEARHHANESIRPCYFVIVSAYDRQSAMEDKRMLLWRSNPEVQPEVKSGATDGRQ